MGIEVTRTQFAALLRGESVAVGATKKIVKLADGPFVIKGGPGSGFAGHVGRLGEVGGAAPAGTPPPPKKMPRQKYAGEPRGLGRVRVPTNREEVLTEASKVYNALHHLVWVSNAVSGKERDQIRKAMYVASDWKTLLERIDDEELADFEKEYGAYTLDILDYMIDRYHIGDYMAEHQRSALEALRISLGEVDYDPFSGLEPDEIPYIQQYIDYAPEDLKDERWYQRQVARAIGLGLREHNGELIFNPHEAWCNGIFDEVQPDIASSIMENWASRAVTEDTPEHRLANALGGSDPYFYIHNLVLEYDPKQYDPKNAGQDAGYAAIINDAWLEATTQPGSVLFSEAVAEQFGGTPIPRERAGVTGIEEVGVIESALIDLQMSEENALEAGNRIVNQIYLDTQQWLAERGYKPGDTVRLYRGLGTIADKRWNPEGEEGQHKVEMWSASSWSYDIDTAYGFAQMRESDQGAIVAADVPIERLLANSDTGPPNQNEGEWIVLGGDGINAQVYQSDRLPYVIEWGMEPDTSLSEVVQIKKINDSYADEHGFEASSRSTRSRRGMLGVWVEEAFPFRSPLPTLPIDAIADRWIGQHLANIGVSPKAADDLEQLNPETKQSVETYRGIKRASRRRRERELKKLDARILADQISSIPLPSIGPIEPEDIAAAVAKADWITRGGPGSGFAGHVGRPGEVGGAAPAGTPAPSKYGEYSPRPRHQVYGTQVFTPMLKEIVYSWQGKEGWGVAQQILYDIERARRHEDESVQGLALGADGELVGIAALDYDATPKRIIADLWRAENINPLDMIKINGMFAAEEGNGEEMMIQVAIEAAAHGKGIWAICGRDALAWYAQMGFRTEEFENRNFAYLSAEQVSNIAETFTMPEQLSYVPPSAKPRWTIKFEDAFDEYVPENPVSDEPPPAGPDQMDFQERYRWETINYEQGEPFNPEQWGRTQAGYGEEDFIGDMYDAKIVEEVENITRGWIDGGPTEGSDNIASIRFSEGVASAFGGEPIPEDRVLGRDLEGTFDSLVNNYGSDLILQDYENKEYYFDRSDEEIGADLIEFIAFADGMREHDMSLDTTEFAQRIYEDTQARLSEAGFKEGDTVRLYRGLRSTPETRLPEGADGGWVDLDMYSVSSWTFSKSRAGHFACLEGGAGSPGGSGTLVSADVPIERLLADYTTGPAAGGEMEWLVLGQDGIRAYLTKVDQRRPLYEAQEELAEQLTEEGVPEAGLKIGEEAE